MEATTILSALSDFLFCRNVLTPSLAVVVGLKADRVAEAGNDVGWVCIWRTLREKKPSFSTKFLLTCGATTVCFKQRCSHIEARHVLQNYQIWSLFYVVFGIMLLIQ